MTDTQYTGHPTETPPADSSRSMQRSIPPSRNPSRTPSRLIRSILVGTGITLLLTIIELVLIWLFNPFHFSTHDSIQRLTAALTFPEKMPILLLVPAVELLGVAILTFRLIRPLAIRAYLRAMRDDVERYRIQH